MADPNGLPKIFSEGICNVWSWAELPHDLLFLLIERIVGLTTFIRFGAVCRTWHWLASTSKQCSYKPVPWLMLSETEGTHVRQFYDISTNEIYELPLPQARGRKILGCAHGWVITVGEGGEFHVLNPLTGIEIALPPRPTFQSIRECPQELTPQQVRDLFAIKATLSFDPSKGDFVAMVVHLGYTTRCLSYCRSSDEGWMNFPRLRQDGIDFAGGKFYTFIHSRFIFACHVVPEPSMVTMATLPFDVATHSYYTVECGGELLVIKRIRRTGKSIRSLFSSEKTTYRTDSFKVYKMDLEDKNLIEIKSIGDHALFVGNNNAICLPATTDIKAYKRNCIYFTDDYFAAILEGGLDMGVFSLDNYSFQLHYPYMSKSTYSIPIWVVPNCY